MVSNSPKWCISGILILCLCLACNSKLQLSDEKDIIEFRFTECSIKGTIDAAGRTVTVSVPLDVDIANLAPTITVSPGASIDPLSNQPNNFTVPQDYTVTAEDGSTQDYTVTVAIDSGECLLVVDVQNLIFSVGLISNGCVEATCRGANDLGYKVLLVRDAHSTTYINPESMIEQTNNTLESEGIVELIYTDDVVFE